jgi:hypothetical protein
MTDCGYLKARGKKHVKRFMKRLQSQTDAVRVAWPTWPQDTQKIILISEFAHEKSTPKAKSRFEGRCKPDSKGSQVRSGICERGVAETLSIQPSTSVVPPGTGVGIDEGDPMPCLIFRPPGVGR